MSAPVSTKLLNETPHDETGMMGRCDLLHENTDKVNTDINEFNTVAVDQDLRRGVGAVSTSLIRFPTMLQCVLEDTASVEPGDEDLGMDTLVVGLVAGMRRSWRPYGHWVCRPCRDCPPWAADHQIGPPIRSPRRF